MSSTSILSRPTGPRELFTMLAIADAAITAIEKKYRQCLIFISNTRDSFIAAIFWNLSPNQIESAPSLHSADDSQSTISF